MIVLQTLKINDSNNFSLELNDEGFYPVIDIRKNCFYNENTGYEYVITSKKVDSSLIVKVYTIHEFEYENEIYLGVCISIEDVQEFKEYNPDWIILDTSHTQVKYAILS